MLAYLRLVLTIMWVILTFSFRMLGFVFSPFSSRVDEWFRRTAFVGCSKGFLAGIGIRLTVDGTPPQAPFFLVTNHISLADIFVLGSRLGCVFVSKSEIGKWPVLGFITRRMKTIFINRAAQRDPHRVIREITEVMNSGLGVVVFPESTTTMDGRMLPFKPALLQTAVDLEMPVHVASLWYGTPDDLDRGNEAVLWQEGVSTVRHFLNIARLGGCECRLVFSEETATADERRALAAKAQEAAERVHTPMG